MLLAISFADRPSPLLLFLGCAIDATVVEWLTAKLLERVNRRRWWDYSGKRFNVDGYICLQYSLLWGALGTATVLWGNGLLFKLYGLLPQWLVRPLLWVSITMLPVGPAGRVPGSEPLRPGASAPGTAQCRAGKALQ